MLRFRLFGIPFEVAPYFWIFSAVLGGNAAHGPNALLLLAIWVTCVFVSIVVHELGHALMAAHYGASPVVRLYAMGGVTQPGQGFARWQSLRVVLCGPAAGFAFFALIFGSLCFRLPPLPAGLSAWTLFNFVKFYPFLMARIATGPAATAAWTAVADLLFINLYWTLFNLLPILPLDGGLISRSLLGYNRAGVARIIGVICAVGCAVYAVSIGQLYLAFFMGFLAYQNLQGGAVLPGSPGK